MDKLVKKQTQEVQITTEFSGIENAMLTGDLSQLSSEQRLNYYGKLCQSLGLNPLTKPFEYISFKGKTVLYAKKDATEQLRASRKISLSIIQREHFQDVYIVTAKAITPDGRSDESTGVVEIGNLKGSELANAIMKAETKAKRRVTLSVCGLGFLDESELETIPEGKATQYKALPIIKEYDSDIHAEPPKVTQKQEPPVLTAEVFNVLKDEGDHIAYYCDAHSQKMWQKAVEAKKISGESIAYLKSKAHLDKDEVSAAIANIEQAYGAGEELNAFSEFVLRGEWWQAIMLNEKAIEKIAPDDRYDPEETVDLNDNLPNQY